MQSRSLLAYVTVLLVAFTLVVAPTIVVAQTTSVTILSSPPQVAIASDGTASFDMKAQITYTGYSQVNSILALTLMYHGTTNPLRGSVSSTPDSCDLSLQNSNMYGYTVCFMKPSASSGTETVTFTLIIFNAQIQQYHLDVNTGVVSTSAGGNSVVGGSKSTTDFYVTVGNQQTGPIQSQTAYTLPSPVTVSGGCGSDCWESQIFVLQQGTIQVTVSECQSCQVYIDNTNMSIHATIAGPISPMLQGGPGSQMIQTYSVADTGTYQVVLGNEGNAGAVSSVVVFSNPNPVPEFSSPSVVVVISVLACATILISKRKH